MPSLPAYADSAVKRAAVFNRAGYDALGMEPFSIGRSDATTADVSFFPADHSVLLNAAAGAGSIAWAIFRLEPTGLPNDKIHLNISGLASGMWYAVSDYSHNRWDWRQKADGPEGSDSVFPVLAEHQTATGAVYVAVLVYNGGSVQLSALNRTGSLSGSDSIIWNPTRLEVGPGKTYSTLEDAYDAAPSSGGADIVVYPQAGNAPYLQPHLLVYKPDIHFYGNVTSDPNQRVKFDGTGYNYTGAGSVPRAVFQFNPGADGCTVWGFEIYEAHNDTYNGAAVRINQANYVSVVDCDIHDCDMGMMSNGLGDGSAVDQQIRFCTIHNCGNLSDPGYNHNLYLGGWSVTLHCCEVYGSLTGHNVKSRAHFNRIEYCYVHDSANREFDLVDGVNDTVPADSDSVLLGNVIVKDPAVPGNRNVIHFGQDGGNDHNGTIYLVNNTIVTPFISPVVALDAHGAGAQFINNIVWDGGSYQFGQVLADASNGASLSNVNGSHNWLAAGFGAPAFLESATTWVGANNEQLDFADTANGDYRLASAYLNIADMGFDLETMLPLLPTPSYHVPTAHDNVPMSFGRIDALDLAEVARPRFGATDLGAYEYVP